MRPQEIRILLVEDSAEDIALTRRVLRKAGLDRGLAMAADGREALESLERMTNGAEPEARLPDLILLDINLPDLSGLEILTRIKKDARFTGIPVVMLTGSNTGNDIQRSYDLGAATYLVKPVSIEALKLAMKNLFSVV